MKKLIIFTVFFLATTAHTQTATDSSSSKKALFAKKSWELSLMGSFNGETIDNGDPNVGNAALSISISPAYYLFDGLSLEPEFTTLVKFGQAAGAHYQLLMNIGYTFRTTKSFHPYIKAGYGIGDMVTRYFVGTQGASIGANGVDDFVECINSGIGIKWMVGSNAAIKTELNYRVQQYSTIQYDWYEQSDQNVDISVDHFGILLGMSIIL
jgi:hypothetical protein